MQNGSVTSFGKATASDLSFHGKSSASLESPIRISDPNSLAYPFSLPKSRVICGDSAAAAIRVNSFFSGSPVCCLIIPCLAVTLVVHVPVYPSTL